MASYCGEDEIALLKDKIDQRAARLFRTTKGGTQLEVIQLLRPNDSDERKEPNQQVEDQSQIKALRKVISLSSIIYCCFLFTQRISRIFNNNNS